MPLLQEMFQRVYGVRSSSNNNLWLRKKLIEAVNTRGRGGSGSGSDAPRPTYHPRPVMRGDPTGGGGAAAGGGGEDAGRRRRKKSAPTRASDGLQVMLGREAVWGCSGGGGFPACSCLRRQAAQCTGMSCSAVHPSLFQPLILWHLQADPENAAEALLTLLGGGGEGAEGGGSGWVGQARWDGCAGVQSPMPCCRHSHLLNPGSPFRPLHCCRYDSEGGGSEGRGHAAEAQQAKRPRVEGSVVRPRAPPLRCSVALPCVSVLHCQLLAPVARMLAGMPQPAPNLAGSLPLHCRRGPSARPRCLAWQL